MADDPANWSEHEYEGRPFWHNEVTKESTYDKPACLLVEKQVSVDSEASKTWYETKDNDGYSYYYTADGETTYRRPIQLGGNGTAWNVEKDPEGQVFYFNVDTFESVYEKPAEVAEAEAKLGLSSDLITVKVDSGRTREEEPLNVSSEIKDGSSAADTKEEDPSYGTVFGGERAGVPFSKSEFEEFVAYFTSIDSKKQGCITKDALRSYALNSGLQLSEETLEDLITDKDLNNDGKISLREHLLSSGRPLPSSQEWFHRWVYDWIVADNSSQGCSEILEILSSAFDSTLSPEALAKRVAGKSSLAFSDFSPIFHDILSATPF